MRQLTTIAALVVALVTPAAARSRLVVLDRPTLACSDQQALETALTLARLHDGPAFRDHVRSYGCMWIEPDDGPLAVVGGIMRIGSEAPKRRPHSSNRHESQAELIELRPDVMLAAGLSAAVALRQQSLSIPIVFLQVADPVSAGFVTNLARPEGNITGFTNFEFSIGGKWLQLLKECAPGVSRIAVVFDAANPSWAAYLRTIEAVAPPFGVQLTPVSVRDAAELKQRISAFARETNGAIVVFPSPVAFQHRASIIAAAAEQRLPAMYPYRFFTVDG